MKTDKKPVTSTNKKYKEKLLSSKYQSNQNNKMEETQLSNKNNSTRKQK
jgi:hypothetical protein